MDGINLDFWEASAFLYDPYTKHLLNQEKPVYLLSEHWKAVRKTTLLEKIACLVGAIFHHIKACFSKEYKEKFILKAQKVELAYQAFNKAPETKEFALQFPDPERSVKTPETKALQFSDPESSVKTSETKALQFPDRESSVEIQETKALQFSDPESSVEIQETKALQFSDPESSVKIQETKLQFSDPESSVEIPDAPSGNSYELFCNVWKAQLSKTEIKAIESMSRSYFLRKKETESSETLDPDAVSVEKKTPETDSDKETIDPDAVFESDDDKEILELSLVSIEKETPVPDATHLPVAPPDPIHHFLTTHSSPAFCEAWKALLSKADIKSIESFNGSHFLLLNKPHKLQVPSNDPKLKGGAVVLLMGREKNLVKFHFKIDTASESDLPSKITTDVKEKVKGKPITRIVFEEGFSSYVYFDGFWPIKGYIYPLVTEIGYIDDNFVIIKGVLEPWPYSQSNLHTVAELRKNWDEGILISDETQFLAV